MRKETKCGALAAVSGTGAWLLPAWGCPLCLAAFAGTMSTIGLGFLASEVVLTPLTIILLGAAVFTLGYSARKRRRYGSLFVGALGAVILIASKFTPAQPWLSYAGIASLLGASVWNARIGRSPDACTQTASQNNPQEERCPMTTTRTVEIFSAGCSACIEVVELVRRLACDSCDVRVLDMGDAAVSDRARALGIKAIPAVAVDGELAECCRGFGVTERALREAGIGQPFA